MRGEENAAKVNDSWERRKQEIIQKAVKIREEREAQRAERMAEKMAEAQEQVQ